MATEPNNVQENIVTDNLTVNEGITLKEGAVLKMPNGTNIVAVAANGQSAAITGTETITGSELEDGTVTTDKIAEEALRMLVIGITKADILAMNGTPVVVVPSPGAGKVLQFLNATLIYDRATATYGGGGDVTINYAGGAPVSNTVVKTDCFGAAGDKIFYMGALNPAGGYTMPPATGLVITNATGAFTDPGTAAGVGRLSIQYRIITTAL